MPKRATERPLPSARCRGCPHVRFGCPQGLGPVDVGRPRVGTRGPLSVFVGLPGCGEHCSDDDGATVRLSAVACATAEEQAGLCTDCSIHHWALMRLAGGRWQGRPSRLLLALGYPRRCRRDGRLRKDLPAGLHPSAGMPVGTLVGVVLDAVTMSVTDAAERHGVPRSAAAGAFRAFVTRVTADYVPAVPPGCEYLGLDVGHVGGERHLQIAALVAKGETGSCVIATLPYSSEQRDAVVAFLRQLPGRERLKAVCTDLADDLRALCRDGFADLPDVVHVGDPRHCIRTTLLPLAGARHAATGQLERTMGMTTPAGRKLQGVKFLLESRPHDLDPDQRAQLATLLRIAPAEVATLHRVKERISDILRITDRDQLDKALDELAASIDSLDPAADRLRGFLQTILVDFRESVLNSADHKISTGYVENSIKFFKYRYKLWSVVDNFDAHYVRTLVIDGPIAPGDAYAAAWDSAAAYLHRRRSAKKETEK